MKYSTITQGLLHVGPYILEVSTAEILPKHFSSVTEGSNCYRT